MNWKNFTENQNWLLTSVTVQTLTWYGVTHNRTFSVYCRNENVSLKCLLYTLYCTKYKKTTKFYLLPQEPGQGSLHLLLMQDSLGEQSSLMTHSGRQFGGAPMYPGKHWHEGVPPWLRQVDEGPHGFGWHGSRGVSIFSISCRIGWQLRNGSPIQRKCLISYPFVHIFPTRESLPVWSGPQLQMGLWLKTSHLAFSPHVPWQGSIHFWFTQACVVAHSLLVVHSGRHCGGVPMKPWRHEQTEWPLISLHWLLGPQGDGLHGCSSRFGGFGVSIWVQTPIGLPVYPGMHIQFGEWFCTRHSAFTNE